MKIRALSSKLESLAASYQAEITPLKIFTSGISLKSIRYFFSLVFTAELTCSTVHGQGSGPEASGIHPRGLSVRRRFNSSFLPPPKLNSFLVRFFGTVTGGFSGFHRRGRGRSVAADGVATDNERVSEGRPAGAMTYVGRGRRRQTVRNSRRTHCTAVSSGVVYVDGADVEPSSSKTQSRTLCSPSEKSNMACQMLLEEPGRIDEKSKYRREENIAVPSTRRKWFKFAKRSFEHVLLVTHGIGQRLGVRMESVNFVTDVNSLRKSIKAVYAASPDLQALNSSASTTQVLCSPYTLAVSRRISSRRSTSHPTSVHTLTHGWSSQMEN